MALLIPLGGTLCETSLSAIVLTGMLYGVLSRRRTAQTHPYHGSRKIGLPLFLLLFSLLFPFHLPFSLLFFLFIEFDRQILLVFEYTCLSAPSLTHFRSFSTWRVSLYRRYTRRRCTKSTHGSWSVRWLVSRTGYVSLFSPWPACSCSIRVFII